MDLTINDVQTIAQFLERANKFIAMEEKEKLKEAYHPSGMGGARGKRRFWKGRHFEVGKSSKWVPNNVYQTIGNPIAGTLETKNDPYCYQNLRHKKLKISRGELYEKMKGKMEFPKPRALRYET